MNLKTWVIVANTGDSSLSIIDPILRKEIRRTLLLPGVGPYDLAKCGLEGNILVTQHYEGTVALIEVATGRVLESLALGRCPSYTVYDDERGLAFISNCDSNSVSILSAPEMRLIGQIGVGSMPQGMDIDPLREVLVVANADSRDLCFIDLWDFFIIRKIKLKDNPFHIKYSRDGQLLFVSSSSTQNEDNGTILVMDTESCKILYTIALEGMPGRLYTTIDGKHLLVTSLGRGGIEIFETRTGRSVKKIPTNGMTQGITSDSEEKYVYVTNTDDNSVSVIDLRLGRKIGDIGVGKEPNGIIVL